MLSCPAEELLAGLFRYKKIQDVCRKTLIGQIGTKSGSSIDIVHPFSERIERLATAHWGVFKGHLSLEMGLMATAPLGASSMATCRSGIQPIHPYTHTLGSDTGEFPLGITGVVLFGPGQSRKDRKL